MTGLARVGAGGHRLLVEAAGAVRRAHQRAGHHAGEADVVGLVLELDELLGLDPPLDRVVPLGRAEVLGDGEQVAAGVVQVAHRLADLLAGLAHAEDEVALGDQPVRAGLGEHVERAVVAERRTDALEDARHGLDVVGQHLGPGVEDLLEQLGDAVEVGDQVLDAGAGVELVDLPDGLGVQPGAAVGEVVAGDAGDGGVAQLHLLDALGHAARLVAVERGGLAGVDLAEVAAPGALLAADEERGLAVLPALEDVGAAGFLADGVQTLALDEVHQLVVLRAHLGPGLDPLGLLLDGGLGVADLEAQHLAAFRSDRHAAHPTWPTGTLSATSGGAGCEVRGRRVVVPAEQVVEVWSDRLGGLGHGDPTTQLDAQRGDAGVGDAARHEPVVPATGRRRR